MYGYLIMFIIVCTWWSYYEMDISHEFIVEHGCIPLPNAYLSCLPVWIKSRGFGIVEADGPRLLGLMRQDSVGG